MENNMYDKKGFLKPEYTLTESEKRAMLFNNDIEIINLRIDFGKVFRLKALMDMNMLRWKPLKPLTKHFSIE